MLKSSIVVLAVSAVACGGAAGDPDNRPKVETICNDGVDQDADGAVDCDDSDCNCTPAAECGNGVREGSEVCDGSDLGGATCASRGFDGGTLRCNSSCGAFNTSSCTNDTPTTETSCTNGVDDDDDQDTDCDDSDCASNSACQQPGVEDCDNGVDDSDADSDVDCADSECASAANCQVTVPENCTNGVDDADADTDVDCADSECASLPACLCGNGAVDEGEACDGGIVPTTCAQLGFTGGSTSCDMCELVTSGCTGESCVDGQDNDADMDADCDDSDCTAICADACEAPLPLAADAVVAGDTTGHAFFNTLPMCTDSFDGPAIAYTFTPAMSGRFACDALSLDGADLVLAVFDACDGGVELGCGDDSGNDEESVVFEVDTTDPVTIVIGGYLSSDEGAYVMLCTALAPETECADFEDNDRDGFVDCRDAEACGEDDACAVGAGATGDACDAANDCASTLAAPACLTPATGFLGGGFCSSWCDSVIDCAPGEVCAGPNGAGLCMIDCERSTDCPSGYTCDETDFGVFCVPACTSDAQCGAGSFCDRPSGSCSPLNEACANEEDDDGDGDSDCDDQDCIATCQPTGLTEVEVNDTFEAANTWVDGFTAAALPGAVDTDVIEYTFTEDDTIEIFTSGAEPADCAAGTVDTYVLVFDAGEAVIAENDDIDEVGGDYCSSVMVEGVTGDVIHIVVWSTQSLDIPHYEVHVTPAP